MIASPQAIRIDRGGIAAEAVISWRYERDGWTVELASAATGAVAAHAADAFEALCLVRERLDAVVDTFAPVDPTTTSTVAAQQAVAERAGLGRPSA